MLGAQLFAFGIILLSGFLLGLCFDLYRVLRALWQPGPLWTRIGDLLFWFNALCLLSSLLLVGNWGELRLYVLVGWALGFLLYQRLLSRYLVKVSFTVFSLAHRSFAYLGRGFYLFWASICRRFQKK